MKETFLERAPLSIKGAVLTEAIKDVGFSILSVEAAIDVIPA